ncbi:MAG TPA: M23 family metallopeptidase [Bacteroidales bacterium]|nr:M23 family metallopeptidase [Bacteroidales bacterium]
MLLLRFILYSFFIFSNLDHTPKDKNIFAPPVKIPVLLSANFGELRIDHFHSGVDIKTQGVTGIEVFSSADGYVNRISVSPTGFGKALYVRHPSGYSTVYAHLQRFSPEIEAYVKAVQYERKSFPVTLFPPKDKFPVKQGDLIAWSGNSGSSGGPHLHFEVREADDELPVNPLLFSFGINDHTRPAIEKLAVYPLGSNTYINNRQSKVVMNVIRVKPGQYTIPQDKEIIISGNAGFGIKLYDLLDGSSNKCEAYSIKLDIDSTTVFKYVMDGFSFNESRYINSHIDYETWMKDNIRIQRTYALPNDKLSTYKTLLNRGIYRFNDEKLHNVNITITDAGNNESRLSFNVRSIPERPVLSELSSAAEKEKVMSFSGTNKFNTDDISVSIPSGALYDTLNFTYKKSHGTPVMLSDLHSVHNKYTPLQKAYSLSIKPTRIIKGKESKMLIVQLNDNMSKTPVSSTFSDGFLKADILSFGNFYVGIDTIAPSIYAPSLSPGIDLTGRKEIRIKIKDDFSGIKSYEPFVDGKWALFEYDPKNEVIIYRFDEKYLSKGSLHNLSLKVTDNRDNESDYYCDFKW